MDSTGEDTKPIKIKPKSIATCTLNETKPNVEAPVCAVCGDEASGMHYKAMTCEGCKTFFRRNAFKRNKLKCDLDEGKCVMNTYLRRHCAFCRMKKCIAVGMQVDRVWDKDRVKTRKTIVKKPNLKKKEVHTPKEIPASIPSTSAQPQVEIPFEIKELMERVEKAFHKSHDLPNQRVPKPVTSSLFANMAESTENKEAGNTSSTTQESSVLIDNSALNTDPNRNSSNIDNKNMCEKHDHSVNQNVLNMDDKLTTVTKLPDIPVTSGSPDGTPLPITPPSSLSSSQSLASPQGSDVPQGSDADDRRSSTSSSTMGATSPISRAGTLDSTITSYIMQMSLIALRAMITFCKELPIFSQLSWETQAALIKGAFVEFVFLGAVSRFNAKDKQVESFFQPGTAYSRDLCVKAGMANVFDEISRLANKVLPLHLTEPEYAVVYAMCIMSSDRAGIDEETKKLVDSAQEKLAEGLRLTLAQRKATGSFPKAIMLLVDLRNTTDTYKSDIMQVELQSNVITPLLAELFDM